MKVAGNFKIFIVEDDPWYGEIIEYHLSLNPDFIVSRFTTGKEMLANLYKKPDLLTLDFSLPDIKGDALFKKIREFDRDLPVIMISGQEDISVALNLIRSGVSDYLVKNEHTKDLLLNAVNKVRETTLLRKQVDSLREELGQKFSFDKILKGQSEAMREVFSLMGKAVTTNINVSISGETGTGKELVAKAIHYNSERKKKPFVAVNMAAIPSELVESELFGYEKGAFTGANSRKKGKFEEANGGTIFLDEIADMDLSTQSKILRVLQEREVTRVGGNERIKLDVRLIVATHKNLLEEVGKDKFREDLYYRVIGLPIKLPPLRERGSDILILAKHYIDTFCQENRMKPVSLGEDAKTKLMGYIFPGNVRELKSMVELATVLCNGSEIRAADLNFASSNREPSVTEGKTLRQYTNQLIGYYLRKYDNDVMLVARKLDIGKSTIYKLIQQKEINTDQ